MLWSEDESDDSVGTTINKIKSPRTTTQCQTPGGRVLRLGLGRRGKAVTEYPKAAMRRVTVRMPGRPVEYNTVSPRGRRRGDKPGGAEDIDLRDFMCGGKKFSWWGRLCGGGSGPHVEHNSTPFNFLQLRAACKPDATRSLSVKVSSLTGASSLLDDACMDVPRETVDMPPVYARDLFPPSLPRAVPS